MIHIDNNCVDLYVQLDLNLKFFLFFFCFFVRSEVFCDLLGIGFKSTNTN